MEISFPSRLFRFVDTSRCRFDRFLSCLARHSYPAISSFSAMQMCNGNLCSENVTHAIVKVDDITIQVTSDDRRDVTYSNVRLRVFNSDATEKELSQKLKLGKNEINKLFRDSSVQVCDVIKFDSKSQNACRASGRLRVQCLRGIHAIA